MHTSAYRKPFLKWAGGKYRLLPRILPLLPRGERLLEVFAGSAAVFLNCPCKSALICDSNSDLIRLYSALQEEGEAFIRYCASFFVPANNTREAFLRLRAAFNSERDPQTRGALLLYLNRHAFNGLIRYNRSGAFNVPFGRYKLPYFPEREMRAFHKKCRETETRFLALTYEESFSASQNGDVLYCDPPYVPLSSTASFTSYSGKTFTDADHNKLAHLAKASASQGRPVLVSNHDTKAVRELYKGARIESFSAPRMISCKGAHRRPVAELLALFA